MERIPPFQPGDKVVRVDETVPLGGPVKDRTYIVVSICWCCESAGWRIEIEGLSFIVWLNIMSLAGFSWTGCGKCDKPIHGWLASGFRRVNDVSDHTVESLLDELSITVEEPVSV